jgi:hypothetical protein
VEKISKNLLLHEKKTKFTKHDIFSLRARSPSLKKHKAMFWKM